jgi:hypothetical protein
MSTSSAVDKIKGLQEEIQKLDSLRSDKQSELSKALSSLPENSNLVFFYGEQCGYTKRAEPHVNCLEAFIGKRLNRLEVWNNKDNQTTYKESGGEKNCGGVPYFYNKITKAVVCGVSDCEAMKNWAKGAE